MMLEDKHFLLLQFKIKIHEIYGSEFQSFFENIMEKANPDFEKVDPAGKSGDRGNDGWIPSKGIYYQVYSPKDPRVQRITKEVIKKAKKDFYKIKSSWNKIRKVKKYYFVFNEKYSKTNFPLEEALSDLREDNKNIEFEKFFPKNLESIFLGLKQEDIKELGFNIDSREVKFAHNFLKKIETYLDREMIKYASKELDSIQPEDIEGLHDESLNYEYEILKCKILQKLEKTKDAKLKYENLRKRYPNDPIAFLYLAEIYLHNENYEKNEELLQKAESIDPKHWLLNLEKLIRTFQLEQKIDISSIDEENFTSDPKIKSNFYRIYSQILFKTGEYERSESFIERAIHLNTDRFTNYIVKLSMLEEKIYMSNPDIDKLTEDLKNLANEIEKVEQKAIAWGEISPRNQAILNLTKLRIFHLNQDSKQIESLSKETFDLIIQCYFDRTIDCFIIQLLKLIALSPIHFEKLLRYLEDSEKDISEQLSKEIVIQSILTNSLFSEGKRFFETKNKQNMLNLIMNLENNDFDNLWDYIENDLFFTVSIAIVGKEFPEIRKKIIENIPDDQNIRKEILWILFFKDEEKWDDAFNLLKKLDFSKFRYLECKTFLGIAIKKEAWDTAIVILEKFLKYEKDDKVILDLKLQLFNSYQSLGKLKEAIQIGEKILSDTEQIKLLNDHQKESLLLSTISAHMRRSEYSEAMSLLEQYKPLIKTFEYKISLETVAYLKNDEPFKALLSIVDGVKIIKNPSPEEYAGLYLLFIEISNISNFKLDSQESVIDDSFLKFKNCEQWFYIGDKNELDTIKISSSEKKYFDLIDNKRVGDKIIFEDDKNKELVIERIFTYDQYIFWQSKYHFEKLASANKLPGVKVIPVPNVGKTVDFNYLIKFFKDVRKEHDKFFNLYCREVAPFSWLAASEGGITHAFDRILNENKGFITCCGDQEDLNHQKEIAKQIIDGKPFYIDGISVLVLIETGLFEKIFGYLQNWNISQSVITFLFEIRDKFEYSPRQMGSLGYSQEKLLFSIIDKEKRMMTYEMKQRITNFIKFIESKEQNIHPISNANKEDCFTEKEVPAEICDACILAQKENYYVLTDDFLYLKMNEHETKKKAPEYCSTYGLMSVLYDQKKISFDDYLNFFTFLTIRRFRFLPVTIDDIDKTIFSDGVIKIPKPERIRKLNFPLTLSTEYGVTYFNALNVIGFFLINNVLIDDAIVPEMAEKIFAEIISTFPIHFDKKELGKFLLDVIQQTIKKRYSSIGMIAGQRTQEKFQYLSKFIELYSGKEMLI